MKLNEIKPAPGSKQPRHASAAASARARARPRAAATRARSARAGGYHKVGFEGGQMPLQRRLPKRGFVSQTRDDTAEVRLSDLQKMAANVIDLAALKAAGVVSRERCAPR